MAMEIESPEIVEEEHLDYLDALRESGVTNMFGAAPFLRKEFGLEIRDARTVLSYWMHTFGSRRRKAGETA